ncbi:MFS transporter [Micromonospora sp. WMMD956]|uniref:MFS transporter n=1 Tax=Micromonospora TaxID=1873 RepID=UPI00241763B6|nr:MFS transporter [Micromonospora sp. WMMD956]MDG4814171.1 MFS transporter [Micromonospora sp. WMMD956]
MPRPGGRAGRLILAATSFSALGDGFRYTALPLLLLSVGAGTDSLSTAYVVNSVPGVLFVLFGGLLSDRYPSKAVVVLVDLARAVAATVFTVALVLGAVSVWWVYALVFVLAAAEVVYFSAVQVFLADALDGADLGVVNGRVASITTTANSLAGPGAGAFLFGLAPALPFLVDAVSFGAAAVCNARVPARRTGQRETSSPSPRPAGMAAQLAAGFRVTFGDAVLRWFFVFAVTRALAAAAVLSVLAVFVVTDRRLPIAHYGYVLAVGAVGGVVGGWLVSRYGDRVPIWRSMWVANVAFGLSFALLPLGAGVPVIGALLALNLAAAVWAAVLAATYRQRVVARGELGRTSSVLRLGVGVATILGAATAGLLGDALPLGGLFVGLGLLVVAVCGPLVRSPRERSDKDLTTPRPTHHEKSILDRL